MNKRLIAILFPIIFLYGCATIKPNREIVAFSNELTVIDTIIAENIHFPEYQSKVLEVRHKNSYNYSVYNDLREIYLKADSLYNGGGPEARPIKKGAKYGFITGAVIGSAFMVWAFSSSSGPESMAGLSIFAAGEIIAVTTVAGLAIGSSIYVINKFDGGRRMSKKEIALLNDLIKKYNEIVVSSR